MTDTHTPGRNGASGRNSTIMTRSIARWEDAIPRLIDHVTDTVSTPVTRSDLKTELQELIDAAEQQADTAWERGTPCSNCGSVSLNRWVSYPELARHSDGDRVFQAGDSAGTVYAWDCSDCERILAVSPAALLLPIAPGTPPGDEDDTQTHSTIFADNDDEGKDEMNNSPLETISRSQTPNADWQTGSPCPHCHSEFIVEAPLDVYPAQSHDNTYSQGGYGERLQTVAYVCDSCGIYLLEARGHMIADHLSL